MTTARDFCRGVRQAEAKRLYSHTETLAYLRWLMPIIRDAHDAHIVLSADEQTAYNRLAETLNDWDSASPKIPPLSARDITAERTRIAKEHDMGEEFT